jgi:hypothetical protein
MNSERKKQLENEAKELRSKLREHDSSKPTNDLMKSRHEVGRQAISDRLTQVGQELRRYIDD